MPAQNLPNPRQRLINSFEIPPHALILHLYPRQPGQRPLNLTQHVSPRPTRRRKPLRPTKRTCMTPWVAAAYVRFYAPAPKDMRACASVLDLHCVFKLTVREVWVGVVAWWVGVGVVADRAFVVSVGKEGECEGDSVQGEEVRDLEILNLVRHVR
jgi:hypothetical protein